MPCEGKPPEVAGPSRERLTMNANDLFTEEQLDYLVEMLNIGAGNATTALQHLLQCEVNMKMPGVEVLPAPRCLPPSATPPLPSPACG